jgi:hypothetical protein
MEEGQMDALPKAFELGYNFSHIIPVPPDPERTTYVEAGAVSLGVEYRSLNEDTKVQTIGPDGTITVKGVSMTESGLSIHVCETATGEERLRFDDLDEDPHYHYMNPGTYNHLVVYDRAANGDMMRWAMGAIRQHLRTMLTSAQAGELAAKVDDEKLASALEEVSRLVEQHRATDTASA